MKSWRLLLSPAAHGAWNMAVDEAMLEAVRREISLPTIRFYTWSPGCYSLGRFQRASDLNAAARRKPGYSWVRRPTGGRALYHNVELTYSVVAPITNEHVSGSIIESYRKIATALVEGLRLAGCEVYLAPTGDPTRMRVNPVCFDNPSDYELMYNGRKLVGSAQTRRSGALLQHGSLPIASPAEELAIGLEYAHASERAEAIRVSTSRIATLSEALRPDVSAGELAQALGNGFRIAWKIDLCTGDLSDHETDLAAKLQVDKYGSEEWSYRS